MRGVPDNNSEAFTKAAQELRDKGYYVYNPSELDQVIEQYIPKPEWRDYMYFDLSWICSDAEIMAMLPGWDKSVGAKIEHALAEGIGLPIIYLHD